MLKQKIARNPCKCVKCVFSASNYGEIHVCSGFMGKQTIMSNVIFSAVKKTTLWSVLFPFMRDSWRSWGAFSKRRPPACSARRRPRPLQKEMPMPGTAGWFGSGNGSKHVKTFQRCPKKMQYRLNLKSDRYELPHTFHLFNLIYPSNILGLLAMANAYVRCLGFMFLFEGQDVGMGKVSSTHKLGMCHSAHCYRAG